MSEAGEGDPEAAARRLLALGDLPLLPLTDEALGVAAELIEEGPLPETAAVDSLHVGIATVSNMDFLLTWNCRHLANAILRGPVQSVLRSKGYHRPEICTPEELMGEE